jgi:undecaprenyl-diphosphatase
MAWVENLFCSRQHISCANGRASDFRGDWDRIVKYLRAVGTSRDIATRSDKLDRRSQTLRRWLATMPGARLELETLLGLFLFAGLSLAFALIANEISGGGTHAFDNAIIQALRNPANPAIPIGGQSLVTAARDITSLGGQTILTLVTVATVGFLLLSGARHAAVLVLIAVLGGSGLVDILKSLFARVRPDFVAQSVYELSRSFPSGHSTLSAVTYLTLGALLARVQTKRVLKIYSLGLAVLVTMLVGVSRVYLGVHWPTDVLAGWCLGAAWAVACWFVAARLQRSGQVERTTEG